VFDVLDGDTVVHVEPPLSEYSQRTTDPVLPLSVNTALEPVHTTVFAIATVPPIPVVVTVTFATEEVVGEQVGLIATIARKAVLAVIVRVIVVAVVLIVCHEFAVVEYSQRVTPPV
jgi:hypothetical protein